MIPLEKNQESRKAFEKWFKENKVKLLKKFKSRKKKKSEDWITPSNRKKIQGVLFSTSHKKCAYCERKPNEGGGDTHIDHFFPKEDFEDKVFDYDNLLPSCKQCNTVKGQRYFDEEGNNILNPYIEKSFTYHLELDLTTMEIKGVSKNGKATVAILGNSLNAYDYLGIGIEDGARQSRRELKNYIEERIEMIKNIGNMPELLFNDLKSLLKKIDEKERLTATYATILLNNADIKRFIESFRSEPGKYNQLIALKEEKERYCLSV